jgi:aminoglycoside 6'-N-acetyltransferase I
VEGCDEGPVAYLEGIYVQPEFQKQGIARDLVAFAKKWGQEQGCRELASDCLLENHQSLAFHLATGFEEANRLICFRMDL